LNKTKRVEKVERVEGRLSKSQDVKMFGGVKEG
jgi:hypothetical protein